MMTEKETTITVMVRHPAFGTLYLNDAWYETHEGRKYVIGWVEEPSPLGYGHGPHSWMNFPATCVVEGIP